MFLFDIEKSRAAQVVFNLAAMIVILMLAVMILGKNYYLNDILQYFLKSLKKCLYSPANTELRLHFVAYLIKAIKIIKYWCV